MPSTLKRLKIIQRFNKAATSYNQFAVLYQEIGRRMLERMELIRIQPLTIVDLGCGTGVLLPLLKKCYPQAQVLGLDIASNMLSQAAKHSRWFRKPQLVCADAAVLPFAAESVDFVFSNMMLPWSIDIEKNLQEIYRVLKPGGLLMFTTFGPDTLKELRACWADSYTHVHPFIDMHDIGDILLHAHLADPVMDIEYFTLTYSAVQKLLHELKATGASNASSNALPGLTGKNKFQLCLTHYEKFRTPENLIPATFEIVYGHAWKLPQKNKNVVNDAGEVIISIDKILKR